MSDVDIGALDRLPSQATASSRRSRPFSRPGATARWSARATSVTGFAEKPRGDGGLINGGFFVLSPKCIDLIEGDATPWEAGADEPACQPRVS